MNQRPLKSGEVAVLRVLVQAGDHRWFQPSLVHRYAPGLTRDLIERALRHLVTDDLAVRRWEGFTAVYAITTLGESALANHDQHVLFT